MQSANAPQLQCASCAALATSCRRGHPLPCKGGNRCKGFGVWLIILRHLFSRDQCQTYLAGCQHHPNCRREAVVASFSSLSRCLRRTWANHKVSLKLMRSGARALTIFPLHKPNGSGEAPWLWPVPFSTVWVCGDCCFQCRERPDE